MQAKLEAERQQELHRPIKVRVGAVGVMSPITVLQIQGPGSMLVTHGTDTIWLKGFSTARMVDGRSYKPRDLVQITGTKQ